MGQTPPFKEKAGSLDRRQLWDGPGCLKGVRQRMNIELWRGERSGVLHAEPLLLKGCRANAFGTRVDYPGGSVYSALFTYLSGAPDAAFFAAHPELFFGRYLVCMSGEWERFLRAQPSLHSVMARRMMRPLCAASPKALRPLPEGYRLSPFDSAAFAQHPFGHGGNYADYDEFERCGSGAAVWYRGEVVASASSFITLGSEVELDVSTDERHRRKGLADHCVAAMLEDGAARGLWVHWDAQNTASACMAQSHGFVPEQDYAVYLLKEQGA